MSKDKTVIITGASRGIGKATACRFAREGYFLALCCRNKENGDHLETELKGISSNFIVKNFDISEENDVSDFINEVLRERGKIDILINNAGIVRMGNVEEFSTQDWDEVIAVNLKGTFLMTKHTLPSIPRGGHIVNVGSNASKIGFPTWSSYCASKFGVLGFTRSLREEVRSRGIKVSSVLPGPTKTDIWDSLEGNWDKDKMMSPETTADMIHYVVNQPESANIEEVDVVPSGGNL